MHKSYGVSDKITYETIDMKAIQLDDKSVDIVVFKSVIGALGNKSDQKKALKEIYRILKPNGTLLFAENLEGSKIHQYLRKKFVSWGERWQYVTSKEMKEWNSQFDNTKFTTTGVVALFGRSEKQRKFLSGFDKILTPITPKKWRYILFGVFKK